MRPRRSLAWLIAAAIISSGCAAESADTARTDGVTPSDSTTTMEPSGSTDDPSAAEATTSASRDPSTSTVAPAGDGTEDSSPGDPAPGNPAPGNPAPQPPSDCPSSVTAPVEGDGVTLVEVGESNGATVSAALYPLPDDRGAPWSQWGQGVVLPDGRFVSAVGDHLGADGESWFFEYDPATGVLTRSTAVSPALGHVEGSWGYGKIHAPMVLGPCDEVLTATYWGTRRGLEIGGSYQGDHLVRYDTTSRVVSSLGVPVVGFGIPSLNISADRRWIFGEAVDPESVPDAGAFFVADTSTGDVVFRDDDPRHVGFRSVMSTADGTALYAAGDGSLFRYVPGDDDVSLVGDVLPGTWLRAVSPIAPDGTVYGATREPDHLFRLDPDGTITDLGPTEGYVASLGMSPDGRTVYYVPDAHGGAWRRGTPLIAVDTTTGDRRVVVELNPPIEAAFGVRVGGTYNVVVDQSGERVFIGLNASHEDGDDLEATFGSVVLAVVDLR